MEPAPEPESAAAMFRRQLHVDVELSERLAAGEYSAVEEVAYVPFDELLEVSGLPEPEAQMLRRVARAYLLNEGLGDDFAGVPPE